MKVKELTMTDDQKKRLQEAFNILATLRNDLTYDHVEWSAVSTAWDVLKRYV